jgi:hypothetical protein
VNDILIKFQLSSCFSEKNVLPLQPFFVKTKSGEGRIIVHRFIVRPSNSGVSVGLNA